MTIDEVKQRWVSHSTGKSDLQRQIWDRVAEDYYARELPDFTSDPFLRIMEKQFSPDQTMRSLDIGCGAGRYTLAMAARVETSVGVDLSPKMIRLAQQRATESQVKNVSFQCLDWAEADIDALEYRGAFDIVFAHMTPAIMDYATFEKMSACSRRYCIFEKHTRRTDLVLHEALSSIGMESSAGFNESLIYAFAALWQLGYSPRIEYRDTVHRSQKSSEDMFAWCVNRARLQRDISGAEEAQIRSVVDRHTAAGQVEEVVSSTIVSIFWDVQNHFIGNSMMPNE